MGLADARNQKYSEAQHGGNWTVSQNRNERYLGRHQQPDAPDTPVSDKEREHRSRPQDSEIGTVTETTATDDGTESVESIRSQGHQALGDGSKQFDGKWGPQAKLLTYDGSSDWVSFIIPFERMATRYGWTEDDKMNWLFEALRGSAL